jgi:hypothetical protein
MDLGQREAVHEALRKRVDRLCRDPRFGTHTDRWPQLSVLFRVEFCDTSPRIKRGKAARGRRC